MKCSFYAEVFCMLTFTNQEWEFIIDAFKNHYDGSLKAAAECGGWLYGLNNQREYSDDKENCELKFSFREVDRMITSLEMSCQYKNDELAKSIDGRLRKVINKISFAAQKANESLPQLTIENV